MLIPLDDIRKARSRIAPYLPTSPVQYAESYSARLNAEVIFKLELFLPTHAFKVRGALNAMLNLSNAERQCGVVTASAGNHGLGLSHAAQQSGVKATIVVPETTPHIRCDAIERMGGELIVHGEVWNEANQRALELTEQRGYTYLSPFDHPDIMAGQGTIALELLEQAPHLDVILCSIGGGGLISGIASAVKQLQPEVRVIGVETLGADCMSQSLEAGKLVELPAFTSIAESLGTKRSSERQLAIVQNAVERVVTVPDEMAARELVYTLNFEKILCEPAASCNLAALTQDLVPEIQGKTVAVILCGGNITLGHVTEWLERFGISSHPKTQSQAAVPKPPAQ